MPAKNETPWGPDGDIPGCIVPCDKCKQLRLRENATPGRWCRRCKYTHYDEYFGEGREQCIVDSAPCGSAEVHPAHDVIVIHGYNDDAGPCPGTDEAQADISALVLECQRLRAELTLWKRDSAFHRGYGSQGPCAELGHSYSQRNTEEN